MEFSKMSEQKTHYWMALRNILNDSIPISVSGFKHLVKKNVTAYHVTDEFHFDKMVSFQNDSDIIIPTFTTWLESTSGNSPFDGVGTRGGYVFELEGDLLFASAIDMYSQRALGAIWINLTSINEFQLVEPPKGVATQSFFEYLCEIMDAIKDAAIIEMVKPSKFSKEFNATVKPDISKLNSSAAERARILKHMVGQEFVNANFELAKIFVENVIDNFNDYVAHEDTLWKSFLDTGLSSVIGDDCPNNEFLLSNFTIKKVYVSDAEYDNSESPANKKDYGIPLGTEKEFNKVLGL